MELNVIGVRRSPRAPDDPVDELHPHRNRELRECDQDSRAQAAMSALRANHGKEA